MNRNEALGQLIDFHMGFLKSGCLYTVVKLNVPDALTAGPRTSDGIAADVGADPHMLYRIMRFLAGEGIFEELPGRTFALTPLSELLVSDIEGSFSPFVLFNSEAGFEALIELTVGVQEGRIPFEVRFGKHPFGALERDRDTAGLLERGWQGIHWPETEAILSACELDAVRRLVDIGGGHGHVMTRFLDKYPAATGVIFDLPSVAEHALKKIAQLGLSERCEVVAGNFFKALPVRADAYFLRHILHDWNDAQCLNILRNVAAACEPGDRVLIAECIVTGANQPDVAKLFDIEMMLYLSGHERTEEEYIALLEAGGFEYTGTTATDSIASVIEGRFPGR